jgi:two-component system sensor histidine kinase VicK
MSSEQMGHLFEQFYRANVSTSGGTGLGLTICKTIIELHDGIIWAESEYGHGSAFYFRLPVTD